MYTSQGLVIETGPLHPGHAGMDYSVKSATTTSEAAAAAVAKATIAQSPAEHRQSNETRTDSASSPPLPEQRNGSHPCPACPIVLSSRHELSCHLRGHNSPRSTEGSGEDEFSCAVCKKVLCSASSLDRHVFVHSRERPYQCAYCNIAFTTNGNMNRHLKSAHAHLLPPDNSCTDSEASCDSDKSLKSTKSNKSNRSNKSGKSSKSNKSDQSSKTKRREAKKRHIQGEYNNNEVAEANSPVPIEQQQQQQREPEETPVKRQRLEEPPVDYETPKDRKIVAGPKSEQTASKNGPQTPECPVCHDRSFASTALLEGHLESRHPGYKPKCEICDISFSHHREFHLHMFVNHSGGPTTKNGKGGRRSIVGFHDLTFMDFSSDTFPRIARAVCESALHRPVTGEIPTFQCIKCLRGFPCQLALDAHAMDCGTNGQPNQCVEEEPPRRDDFFAGLDLQNNAALAEAREGKDLADIQSIISVTSGPILQNFPRSDASTPEQQVRVNQNAGSSGSSGTPGSDNHQDEEMQEAFNVEFRRMKVKGEFPCRLCPEVFPNLRALKGHNRVHLCVAPGSPYPCNMCLYTTPDKTTIIRHLRSHNGDRPFECAACRYAFTTKANCERHLRNRHGKTNREEIKSSLIYHPNEDYTNDGSLGRNSPRGSREDARGSREDARGSREDARRSLVYPNEQEDLSQQQASGYSAMHAENRHEQGSISDDGPSRSFDVHNSRASSSLGHYERSELGFPRTSSHSANPFDLRAHVASRYSETGRFDDDMDSRSSEDGSVSLVSDTKSDVFHQRVEASPLDLKKSPVVNIIPASAVAAAVEAAVAAVGEPSTSGSCADDAPLDLSMDVLDLSKKSKKNSNAAASNAAASSSSGAGLASCASSSNAAPEHKDLYDATKQFFLTQALLKARQATAPSRIPLEALYANAQMMCRNFPGFAAAGVGAGLLPPYLFNPHVFGQDMAMKNRLQKELVRGLQLTSGGSLVQPPVRSPAFPGAYQQQPRAPEIPPPPQPRNDPPTTLLSPQMPSPMVGSVENLDNSASSNSVKMVIKNGVLMPKQKQRRYRTERPFACEYCSAKFTLRSNMERHVKQQHPDFWSLKPKGAQSTRGRPPANPPTLLPTVNVLGLQPAQPPQPAPPELPQQPQPPQPNAAPRAGPSSAADGNQRRPISDQVKYAILAQQLKANNKAEENDTDDEEEELVIDEGANDREPEENNEPAEVQAPVSLLRGKLEGSSLYKQQQQQSHGNAKRNLAKDDENDGSDEAEEADEKVVKKVKIEPSEQDHEENSTDCPPSEASAAEVDGDERQASRENANERNGDGSADLASVSELLDNASQQYQQFHPQYISDEEGLVASTSDCNVSGSDEKSDTANSGNSTNSASSTRRRRKLKKKKKKKKKKSAYSSAPNRVICPYCQRPFPWTSSLRRHILTHTGQKPYQCMHCSLLFTTKSNCDRHLLRKHKNNAIKMRRMRNAAASPPRSPVSNGNGNSNNNSSASTNNNSSTPFAMRNVPERPYKCNLCPSSTFSTLGNLKKHKASKHSRRCQDLGSRSSGPDSPGTSGQNSPIASNAHNEHSGYESQSSGTSENVLRPENHSEVAVRAAEPTLQNVEVSNNAESNRIVVQVEINPEPRTTARTPELAAMPIERHAQNVHRLDTADAIESAPLPLDVQPSTSTENAVPATSEAPKSRRPSPRSSPGPADGPFKCHLCDSGFSERQDCLDHIRINHTRSYQILVAKGALDMDIETPEEQQQQQPPQHQSDGEERRGKFPDYSNRKVVCAFCVRRFWSAEDLRRHMRTHTGERPFSCDICLRRFTLKHSMLRHRKKHESIDSTMYVGTSGDEEAGPSQPPTITPRSQQQQVSLIGATSGESRMQERISLPTVASVATGDAAPSGLMRLNPYESLTTLTGTLASAQQSFPANDGVDTENDLISNLLDIRDKSLIDKVLQASPDDAAKLLGVHRND